MMADLYGRLEEIQGMTAVLAGDVERLRPMLGSRSIQDAVSDEEYTHRRSYVRAVFALVEAVVEQHKCLILELTGLGAARVGAGVQEVLHERTFFVKDNGAVGEKEKYLQLERKLRAVYRAAGEAFGQPLLIDFSTEGWRAFQVALNVRDRITHPKTYVACHVEEGDLDAVDKGHAWFREVNNEFVRLARDHRLLHKW
jgi:hypothetical protein